MDDHALAVDVDGRERAGLADAHPCAVGGHQDHAVLQGLDGVELSILDVRAGYGQDNVSLGYP